MIEVFLDEDPGMQPRGGQAAVDEGGWHGGGTHRLTGAAGVLRANVAMHEKARRLHVELLADVLADLDQVAPALGTGARGRFVAVLDARQLRRQGLAPGGLGPAWCRGLLLGQLRGDGRPVLAAGLLEEVALLRGERLALHAKAQALVVGQLQGELLDLQLPPLELGLQGLEARLGPRRQRRDAFVGGRLGSCAHGRILPCGHLKSV